MGGVDFAHFYEAKLDLDRTADDIESLKRLAPFDRNVRLLDAGCGYGRISWALAALGARVTGVDQDSHLIEQARQVRPANSGLTPEFIECDLHDFTPDAPFDVIVSWYSSFGFDHDRQNQELLHRFFDWLVPGGVFIIDLVSRDHLVRNYRHWIVMERGDNTLIDRNDFDPAEGVSRIRRRIHLDGAVSEQTMQMRVYTYPEMRSFLARSGFEQVTVCDHQGRPLTLDSNRMIIRCRKPT